MELTRNETKLMRIFWEAKRPLSRRDIINLNTDNEWDMAALHSIINNLLRKGAISEVGFSKEGKSMGRLFAAEYTLQEHICELLAPVDEFIDYRQLIRKIIQYGNDW